MTRDDLQPYMFLETALRGTDDLGIIIEKNGILYVQFNQCELQVQPYWNKNLFSKGFEGDHVLSIRMGSEPEHFYSPKTAPVIWERSKNDLCLCEDKRINKKRKLNR